MLDFRFWSGWELVAGCSLLVGLAAGCWIFAFGRVRGGALDFRLGRVGGWFAFGRVGGCELDFRFWSGWDFRFWSGWDLVAEFLIFFCRVGSWVLDFRFWSGWGLGGWIFASGQAGNWLMDFRFWLGSAMIVAFGHAGCWIFAFV